MFLCFSHFSVLAPVFLCFVVLRAFRTFRCVSGFSTFRLFCAFRTVRYCRVFAVRIFFHVFAVFCTFRVLGLSAFFELDCSDFLRATSLIQCHFRSSAFCMPFGILRLSAPTAIRKDSTCTVCPLPLPPLESFWPLSKPSLHTAGPPLRPNR